MNGRRIAAVCAHFMTGQPGRWGRYQRSSRTNAESICDCVRVRLVMEGSVDKSWTNDGRFHCDWTNCL